MSSAQIRLVFDADDLPGEDGLILVRAAAGDDAAMRVFYRCHVNRIHRHVGRILGPHDPNVDDVVQRVFLIALDRADTFEGRGKLSSWLIGIATRRALDEARARWRRGRWQRASEWVGRSLPGLGRAATAPDVQLEAGSEAEMLLQTLPPDLRTVFVLKEALGHTLQEISEMTGVGISTLHARLKRARKQLDQAIAAQNDTQEGSGS